MLKKGFSLALTLWIVAIMSLVSALFLSYGKKIVDKTIKLDKKLDVVLKTESMVEFLKFYAMTGDIVGNKIINKNLQKKFPTFPTSLILDGRKIIWNNRVIRMQDTAGLIGISDSEGVLNSLFSRENALKDKKVIIQASINDWLDENSMLSLNGAEDSFYRNKGFNYLPRNENYFTSIDEFLLVRGLTDLLPEQKKSLKSRLIISNYLRRNILTMNTILLGKVYNLSKIETEQLIKAKKESNDKFLRLFYSLNPMAFNSEGIGVSPSRSIQMSVYYVHGKIGEHNKLLISFRPNLLTAFEVLEYN